MIPKYSTCLAYVFPILLYAKRKSINFCSKHHYRQFPLKILPNSISMKNAKGGVINGIDKIVMTALLLIWWWLPSLPPSFLIWTRELAHTKNDQTWGIWTKLLNARCFLSGKRNCLQCRANLLNYLPRQ